MTNAGEQTEDKQLDADQPDASIPSPHDRLHAGHNADLCVFGQFCNSDFHSTI